MLLEDKIKARFGIMPDDWGKGGWRREILTKAAVQRDNYKR